MMFCSELAPIKMSPAAGDKTSVGNIHVGPRLTSTDIQIDLIIGRETLWSFHNNSGKPLHWSIVECV